VEANEGEKTENHKTGGVPRCCLLIAAHLDFTDPHATSDPPPPTQPDLPQDRRKQEMLQPIYPVLFDGDEIERCGDDREKERSVPPSKRHARRRLTRKPQMKRDVVNMRRSVELRTLRIASPTSRTVCEPERAVNASAEEVIARGPKAEGRVSSAKSKLGSGSGFLKVAMPLRTHQG
jgi:hypothetical protein